MVDEGSIPVGGIPDGIDSEARVERQSEQRVAGLGDNRVGVAVRSSVRAARGRKTSGRRNALVAVICGAAAIALICFLGSGERLRNDSETSSRADEGEAAASAPSSEPSLTPDVVRAAQSEPNVHLADMPRADAPNELAPLSSTASTAQMLRQADSLPRLLEIDSDFAAEPVDRSWAPGREAELLGEMARVVGLELLTVQVECRTSACRVQLSQSIPVEARFADSPLIRSTRELFDSLGYAGSPRHPIAVRRDSPSTAT